jgi:TonB family protein
MTAIAATNSPSSVPSRTQPNAQPGSFIERLKPGVPPESLFDAKRVYTLHVNMPNLTSASGSWILNFAELASPEEQKNELADPADLQVPEVQRKVDPKYPPELRNKRVEGEVVLYAVVRADGTVDSIQLIDGIDPALDLNAMQALGKWKFLPAQRRGVPVELEAIVHIPWHASAPMY